MTFTYVELFDIARNVVLVKAQGVEYRPGIERAAALAAVREPTEEATIETLALVIDQHLLTPSAWIDPVV